MELPVLESARLTLRPATEEDVDAIAAILAEPAVHAWWGELGTATVRAQLAGSCAIVIGGEVAGWLHVHEETEPQYPSVSFDVALATAVQGQGYGPEALRLAIRHQIARGHHRFVIDPAAENARAIRAYEAVGFRAVGIMREYEITPDGRRRDGLLMELLARELRDP